MMQDVPLQAELSPMSRSYAIPSDCSSWVSVVRSEYALGPSYTTVPCVHVFASSRDIRTVM